jgi:antitoxin CcdA
MRYTSPTPPLADRKVANRQAQAEKIRKRNGEIWLEENRDAIESYNQLVSEHGVFSAGLRGF